jgi:hypothetical protein
LLMMPLLVLLRLQEEFKSAVIAQNGFEYLPERPHLPRFEEQKWGWTGSEPGRWAHGSVDGESSEAGRVLWVVGWAQQEAQLICWSQNADTQRCCCRCCRVLGRD